MRLCIIIAFIIKYCALSHELTMQRLGNEKNITNTEQLMTVIID